ncbi:MAG: hypothetical protein R6V25_12870 [Desulfatiglandales bacterium]
MPNFSCSTKLTHEELIRAIRYSIAAEYEAIQLYMQLAESTDNEKPYLLPGFYRWWR